MKTSERRYEKIEDELIAARLNISISGKRELGHSFLRIFGKCLLVLTNNF